MLNAAQVPTDECSQTASIRTGTGFGSHGQNGAQDIESGKRAQRSRLSSAIETFSPNWYALCMNTGLLGILLHQFPYKFNGSAVLSTIFYVTDVLLFAVFTTIQIVRHILYRDAAIKQTSASMDELCFWGCLPIALATIVAQTGITASTAASWSDRTQHGFTIFAMVLWWANVALMLIVAFTVYYLMTKWKMHKSTPIPPGAFLPAVGTTTVALVGGIVVTNSYDVSARLAVPVIITGYLLDGFGWWLAVLTFSIFLHQLWSDGFPPAEKLPALLMLIGPAGQAGVALQVLGSAARRNFGGYAKGTFLQAESGASLSSSSVMLALTMLGFDIFWLIFLVIAVAEKALKGQLVAGMPWWSSIFPVGTVCTTFVILGQELDSPTFRVLATGLFIILLIDYLCCWAMTFWLVYKGRLLDGRTKIRKTQ